VIVAEADADTVQIPRFAREADDVVVVIEISELRSTPALADGAATTDTRPAASADTATTAIRLRSVFVDIFFLSLVEIGHFPISARRSC
jgi:hypothetical protein